MKRRRLDSDKFRSKATFRYTVKNLSRLRESQLSQPCYVRNLPWKIMIMPRKSLAQDGQLERCLGFFLQCNRESESSTWGCFARADLRLLSQKEDVESYSRKIKHLFRSTENDWGFSRFISWQDVLDPEKGYIKDDTIILEVHVVADAPYGVGWDSKKDTGYVGLKNQGVTCYMNSVLQSLYFTKQLRKAVYKMPIESDNSRKSVASALQGVFYELQFSDKAVDNTELMKSFGWERDSFTYHALQKFPRFLLDKLESETGVEGTVSKLFEGTMYSFIKPKSVKYTSVGIETFFDIELDIKGKKNIYESFRDYVRTKTLDGDNKYDAGECGLQDAVKLVEFASFPPVLHLRLKLFENTDTGRPVKSNDRFEFYDKINLDKYLLEEEATKADYTLFAVLVHCGDEPGGHYAVFINPKGDGRWCKYDNDVVSMCTKKEAIESNYGGDFFCDNAYMLVYIRDSELKNVLQDLTEGDIPHELRDRLQQEKRGGKMRRKERSEALYMRVNVILKEEFRGIEKKDLFMSDEVQYRQFIFPKQMTMEELMGTLSMKFKCPIDQMRLWPVKTGYNSIRRPTFLDLESNLNKSVLDVAENESPWTVYLEMVPVSSGRHGSQVLIKI